MAIGGGGEQQHVDRESSAVSVVIPSWSRSERLRHCLDGLARQRLKPCEIIVVSAAGDWPDGRVGPGPHTRVVRCPQPGSFCRAANQGIAATRGAWILLLNDDVVLTPAFVEGLLSGIPSDERIGMVCGKLLTGDGRTIDSTGQFPSRARTACERGYGCLDVGQFNEPGYVFSVPGAAALYRRRMLEAIAVGGQYFDEQLGMYLEDFMSHIPLTRTIEPDFVSRLIPIPCVPLISILFANPNNIFLESNIRESSQCQLTKT